MLHGYQSSHQRYGRILLCIFKYQRHHIFIVITTTALVSVYIVHYVTNYVSFLMHMHMLTLHTHICSAPTVVQNLKALTQSYNSIFVSWELPANPNGEILNYNVTYYQVTISRQTKRQTREAPLTVTTSSPMITLDDGISFQVTYNISVVTNIKDVTDPAPMVSVTHTVDTNATGVTPNPNPEPSPGRLVVQLPPPTDFGSNVMYVLNVFLHAKN